MEGRFGERKWGWREAEVSRDQEADESGTVGPGAPHQWVKGTLRGR